MLRSRRTVTLLAPLAALSLAVAPACAEGDDDEDDEIIENPVGGGEEDGGDEGDEED